MGLRRSSTVPTSGQRICSKVFFVRRSRAQGNLHEPKAVWVQGSASTSARSSPNHAFVHMPVRGSSGTCLRRNLPGQALSFRLLQRRASLRVPKNGQVCGRENDSAVSCQPDTLASFFCTCSQDGWAF